MKQYYWLQFGFYFEPSTEVDFFDIYDIFGIKPDYCNISVKEPTEYLPRNRWKEILKSYIKEYPQEAHLDKNIKDLLPLSFYKVTSPIIHRGTIVTAQKHYIKKLDKKHKQINKIIAKYPNTICILDILTNTNDDCASIWIDSCVLEFCLNHNVKLRTEALFEQNKTTL